MTKKEDTSMRMESSKRIAKEMRMMRKKMNCPMMRISISSRDY